MRVRRTGTSAIDDTRRAVAALHHAMATEALYGPAFRRSAGLTSPTAEDVSAHVQWWARQLRRMLQEQTV